MRRLFRFLDSLDRKSRWVLFFPVGIIASFIAVAVVQWGFDSYWGNPRPFPRMSEYATLNFAAGVTRVLFPAVISPKPWTVGIIMFVADVLLTRVGPYAYTMYRYEYMRYRWAEGPPLIAAGIVGGLLGLLLVRVVMHSGAKGDLHA